MSKNVAMFVDVANMYYAARGQDVDVDYVALLKHATKGRDLIRAYAYTGLDPENENQRKFIDFLAKNGYKPVVKDIRKFGDGRMKANLDIELVVDLFRLADRMDIAVIVSGDGDFAPAIRALQDKGVRAEVISFKPNTSSDLIAVADDFMDIMKVASISRKEGRAIRDTGMSAPEMPAKEVTPEFGFREASPSVAAAALAALKTGGGTTNGRRTRGPSRRGAAPSEEPPGEKLPTATATDVAAESTEEGKRRRRRRGGRGRGRSRREETTTPVEGGAEEIGWEEFDDLTQLDGTEADREYTFEEADAATLAELGLDPGDVTRLHRRQPRMRPRRSRSVARERRRSPPRAMRSRRRARAARPPSRPPRRAPPRRAPPRMRPRMRPRRSRSAVRARRRSLPRPSRSRSRARAVQLPSRRLTRRQPRRLRRKARSRRGSGGGSAPHAEPARHRRARRRAGPLGRLLRYPGRAALSGVRLAIDGVECIVDRLGGLRRRLLGGITRGRAGIRRALLNSGRGVLDHRLAGRFLTGAVRLALEHGDPIVLGLGGQLLRARAELVAHLAAALGGRQQRRDGTDSRAEQEPQEECAPVPLLALLDAEPRGRVIDDGPTGRDRGAGRADGDRAPLPHILEGRADRALPRAVGPFRSVGDRLLEELAGVAAHRLRIAPCLVGERADLAGDVLPAPGQLLCELRVGQSVDERSDCLGDLVGRSCRSSRHVVLLWVRPGGWVHEVCHCPAETPSRPPVATRVETYTPTDDRYGRGGLPERRAAGRAAARPALRARRTPRGTLLVHGPRGSGKTEFVDDLLALSFCTDDDAARRPCNACRGCRDARARTHPDLLAGSPDLWREARSTGESIVAAARRWLLDAAGAPIAGERRVVLIEHADQANEQTQNALLKTLEEPTGRHVYILVGDDAARLLPTIRSRCQALRIGPVAHEELVRHLMDRRLLPADQADTLASLANGLSGLAVRYADRRDVLDWRRRLQAELLTLLERGRADRFGAVADLLDEAARLEAPPFAASEGEGDTKVSPSAQRGAAMLVTEVWLGLARDLLLAAAGRPGLAPSGELAPEIGRLGDRIGTAPMASMVRLLERIDDGLRENGSPRLALEAAMLGWPQDVR